MLPCPYVLNFTPGPVEMESVHVSADVKASTYGGKDFTCLVAVVMDYENANPLIAVPNPVGIRLLLDVLGKLADLKVKYPTFAQWLEATGGLK